VAVPGGRCRGRPGDGEWLSHPLLRPHRFYDHAASPFAQRPAEFTLEKAAEDLFWLVKLVKAKTGAGRIYRRVAGFPPAELMRDPCELMSAGC
jgi:hypothetical protein